MILSSFYDVMHYTGTVAICIRMYIFSVMYVLRMGDSKNFMSRYSYHKSIAIAIIIIMYHNSFGCITMTVSYYTKIVDI